MPPYEHIKQKKSILIIGYNTIIDGITKQSAPSTL